MLITEQTTIKRAEMELKDLTKAEEQIMQIVWQIEKGFVKDVMDFLPEPKPAYNTVSTIIRILEVKGFIAHETFGKAHKYYSIISKEDMDQYEAIRIFSDIKEDARSSAEEIARAASIWRPLAGSSDEIATEGLAFYKKIFS